MIGQRFVLEKLPVISAYPFLNVLLQRFRNRDHFVDFAVGYAAADIVATYISLLPKRIEPRMNFASFPTVNSSD
jgi:hypothetical protein